MKCHAVLNLLYVSTPEINWHHTTAVSLKALCVALLCVCGMQAAHALEVPEIVSYMDGNGIYTITGNVKNPHPWAVEPALEILIQDGDAKYTIDVTYGIIPPAGELPFKVKVPEASVDTHILGHNISHTVRSHHITLDVLYDDTLIIHPDGHLSGRAINSGDHTLYDPILWAVIHGRDGPLDVSNTTPLGVVEPGQIVHFEMHPDPAVSNITYYSCFAPSDKSVFPITANRNGQQYHLRYESGAWLYKPVFSDDGTQVTLQSTNSFPFEVYGVVEIPPVTRAEEFQVLLDGKPVEFIQSVDEMGLWHVSFRIEKQSQDVITIRGFEAGPVLPAIIPSYMRDDAISWASGMVDTDTMLQHLELMADHRLLPASSGSASLPLWLAPLMEWWGSGQIDDDEFLGSISYLITTDTVRPG